jgi:hypothetical protein
MNAPGTSDQWDEFLLMCSLFREYESNGGYFKVGIRDITNPDSPTLEDDTKAVLTKMRSLAGTLKFISRQYNAARMPISARPDELILFVSPEFNAALDVEALAGAFNVDKMATSGRIIEIPREQFGIDGVEAILTTKDFFVVADQLFETASQWNPASLQNNYWLHRWQVISASRFVPAIAFSTHGGDEIITVLSPLVGIEAVTITDTDGATPATVNRGEIYQLASAATTQDGNANATNVGVRWALTGNTSPRTYVSFTGVLHIGGDEGATGVTVTATSTYLDPEHVMRNGESTTATYTVSGPVVLSAWPEIDGLASDGTPAALTGITVAGVALTPPFAAGTHTYTVTVPGGTAAVSDVAVTANGVDQGDISISVDKTGKTITVEADSVAGDPVYTITVS